MIGKLKRMNRLFNSVSHNIILTPLDHGISLGVIRGIDHMCEIIPVLVQNGADALILHKGMICRYYDLLKTKEIGLIMHLSASTNFCPYPNYKVLTGSVYDAVVLGCDAVSVHINLGDKQEPVMLKDLSGISSECMKYGMPLIVMIYIKETAVTPEKINHAARVAVELGGDIIKIIYSGDIESFREIVESTPVPIVVAGGEKIDDDRALIRMVSDCMKAGARGVSIGRNIFQHRNMKLILDLISKTVHEGKTVEELF